MIIKAPVGDAMPSDTKYGLKDPGTRISMERIEAMQARIFCGAPRENARQALEEKEQTP